MTCFYGDNLQPAKGLWGGNLFIRQRKDTDSEIFCFILLSTNSDVNGCNIRKTQYLKNNTPPSQIILNSYYIPSSPWAWWADNKDLIAFFDKLTLLLVSDQTCSEWDESDLGLVKQVLDLSTMTQQVWANKNNTIYMYR